jgi:hypothetical protein
MYVSCMQRGEEEGMKERGREGARKIQVFKNCEGPFCPK